MDPKNLRFTRPSGPKRVIFMNPEPVYYSTSIITDVFTGMRQNRANNNMKRNWKIAPKNPRLLINQTFYRKSGQYKSSARTSFIDPCAQIDPNPANKLTLRLPPSIEY